MPTPSRGKALSGYLPPIGAGARVHLGEMNAVAMTGSVLSANVQKAITHTLGEVPSVIIVAPIYGADQAKNFTSGVVVGLSTVSAATSTTFYVLGNKAAAKFQALLIK